MADTPLTPEERQRGYVRTYQANRIKRGDRKVTVWLGPDGQAALERGRKTRGSKDAAIETALIEAYK